jgi:PAS domain S-box-containing protein
MNTILPPKLYKLIQKDQTILSFIFENAPDGFWLKSIIEPENIWGDAKFWNLLGYPGKKKPILWKSLIFEEDYFLNQEFLKTCISDPYSVHKHTDRYICQDGSVVWLSSRIKVIIDDGKPVFILAALVDSIKKRDEEFQTQKRNEYLKSIIRNIGDIVFILDTDFTFKEYYQSETEKLYIQPSQFMGRKVCDIGFPEEVLGKIMTQINSVLETGQSLQTEYPLTVEGVETWYYLVVSSILNEEGSNIELLCVVRNITEQKKTEAKIQENQIKLDSILSSLDDVVWSVSISNYQPIYISPSVEKFYGYTVQEWLDDIDLQKKVIYAEDRHFFSIMEKELFSTGYTEQKYRIQKKDGSIRWVRHRIKVIYSEPNKPTRLDGIITDITDAVILETALQEERKLFINGPTVIFKWLYKDGFPVEYVSQNIFELLGYTSEQFTSDIVHYTEFIYPSDLSRVVTEVENHVKEKRNYYKQEYKLIRKDLRVIDIVNYTIVNYDSYGVPKNILGYMQDVTERKRNENDLEFAKERLIQTNQLARVGSWEYNLIDQTLYWSDITKDIHEVPQHYVPRIKQALNFYKEGHSRDTITEVVQQAIYEGISFDVELSIITAKGNEVWVRAIGHSDFVDKKCKRLYGAFQDIDKAKRTHDALIDSEKRWQFALEGSGDGIWDWNAKTNTVFFSNQWKRMIGYKPHEIGNSLEEWNSRVHPDDKKSCFEALNSHFEGKTEYYTNEHRLRCKDGSYKWILDRGKIIEKDENEKPIRVIGTHTDITERKKMEQELIIAKEKAEMGSRAKSDFLANMSHEIRTPLNGVIGFTDLLMRTMLDDVQKQYMDTVYQSANSLLDLINDILDFSKIEAGKLELNIEKVDLFELVGQVADVIKYKAHDKHLEILLNIPPNLPRCIRVDPIRLRQVMVNLLGNAVKFTEEGEIEIRIKVLELSASESKLEFSVRDTGIGISKQNQKKIFEAFSQEDTSTTRRFGGTGLGLAISNKLLGLMGTYLSLESDVGQGSTFSFILNVQTESGSAIALDKLDTIKKVLAVDDNAQNLYILQEMLSTQGIMTRLVSNGVAALSELDNHNDFDLIIMDYQMPYMDGIEVIRKIRTKGSAYLNHIPILLLYSSVDDEYIHQECKRYNVSLKVVKPIKIQNLFLILSKLDRVEKEESIESVPIKLPILEKSSLAIKVLVVEDNSVNLLLTKTIIKKAHPNIVLLEAGDGSKAYDLYRKEKPDLIFMDIQMPILNGYEASKKIRSLEEQSGRHVPIIALTAGTVKGERERCLEAGMDDFITKPVIADTIKAMIDKWKKK